MRLIAEDVVRPINKNLARNARRVGDLADGQRSRLNQNLLSMRRVFNSLSNDSGFLRIDLIDEALLLLCESKIHVSTILACLKHLSIGRTSLLPAHVAERPMIGGAAPTASTTLLSTRSEKRSSRVSRAPMEEGRVPHCWSVLESLGVNPDRNSHDIDSPLLKETETFDWTNLRSEADVDGDEVAEAFQELASDETGFMCSSEMEKFIKRVQGLFWKKDGRIADLTTRTNSTLLVSRSNVNPTTEAASRCVGFEVFHRVLSRMGFSMGMKHSRVLWIICCSQLMHQGLDGPISQFLPATDVAKVVINMHLRSSDEMDASLAQMGGYFTFNMFRRFIRLIGCMCTEKGIRAMWEDLVKDPMDIGDFLPREPRMRSSGNKKLLGKLPSPRDRPFYLRLEMDRLGMDPMEGRIVSMDSMRQQLPRMLMSGLCSETMKIMMLFSLNLSVPEARYAEIFESMEPEFNHYGLLRLEDVGLVLSKLSVEGMSFTMLKDVIAKMKLDFPPDNVKRMFDMMDLNHDKSLSLLELLDGFEVLVGMFLPRYICEAVGITSSSRTGYIIVVTLGLIAFFAFLIFAFATYTGVRSGMGSALQSVLAVGGALGLHNVAAQDNEKLKASVHAKIEHLFGDALTSAKQLTPTDKLHDAASQQAVPQEAKPGKLRYVVPRRFHPEIDDPRPCVTFHPGAFVQLEPVLGGRCKKKSLHWSISPRLNCSTGLSLDTATGLVSGFIPEASRGRVPRHSYVVVARNSAGASRARITFQILPKTDMSGFL
eukprot:Polyplicarium_translucidae@DN1014_c0_g1_i1.p1